MPINSFPLHHFHNKITRGSVTKQPYFYFGTAHPVQRTLLLPLIRNRCINAVEYLSFCRFILALIGS